MPYTINDSILALRMAGLAGLAHRLCQVESLLAAADAHVAFAAKELRAAVRELHDANAALRRPSASPDERAAAAFTVTKAHAVNRQRARQLARAEHERTRLDAERRALVPIVDDYDPGSNQPLSDFLAAQFLAAAVAA